MSMAVNNRRQADIEEEEKRKRREIHMLVESDWGTTLTMYFAHIPPMPCSIVLK